MMSIVLCRFCIVMKPVLLQNALSEELSNMKKLQDDLLANKVTVPLGFILSQDWLACIFVFLFYCLFLDLRTS